MQHTRMFIAALFQPKSENCSRFMSDRMDKWYIHTMLHYTATRMHELQIDTTMINVTGIMLGQEERHKKFFSGCMKIQTMQSSFVTSEG